MVPQRRSARTLQRALDLNYFSGDVTPLDTRANEPELVSVVGNCVFRVSLDEAHGGLIPCCLGLRLWRLGKGHVNQKQNFAWALPLNPFTTGPIESGV